MAELAALSELLPIDVESDPGHSAFPAGTHSSTPRERAANLGVRLRNPWRFSFDRATRDSGSGRGQRLRKIDLQPASSVRRKLRMEPDGGPAATIVYLQQRV